jgi:hypothetical protein
MKKIVLMVVVAMVAASAAEAATRKKGKSMKRAPAVASQDLNANGKRLVWDSLPSFMPTPIKWIYYSQPQNRGR